ncbi:hypothetical protein [Vogesella indigofera]|uniref:hypothetical protein n=1 Tax=Vogesella indigofera TaxID=45465 RepID=UPI00234F1EEF|nr:hypothetical protein [Vogesella indigofera]MDC7699972.1 hypothetical protein [Vogesella indigofera]
MSTAPWRQRWQQWQSLLPKLHRDGASLPAALLLASLQQQLDSEQLQVLDLQLQPEESVLELDIQQPLRARLQLFFHFGELDWPKRTLLIHYRLQGTPQDSGLIRRALGTLLLTALDAGLGSHLLQRLAAELAFLDIQPQHIVVHLDHLPLATRWRTQTFPGKSLARHLQLKAITTPPGHLRLTLGWHKQG